jgi:spore maturation protein SpmA
VWVILYTISVLLGSLNDDINLMSTSFFLLALAGLEFSFGLLLIVLFKNMKVDYEFGRVNGMSNQFLKKNIKNLYINRYV